MQLPCLPGHRRKVSGWSCITQIPAPPYPSHTPISSLRPALVGPQAESKQVGQSVFRRSLLNRLQQEYKDREDLRTRSLQAWICYVTFICNIFDYLRVRSWSRSTRLLLPVGARRAHGSGQGCWMCVAQYPKATAQQCRGQSQFSA